MVASFEEHRPHLGDAVADSLMADISDLDSRRTTSVLLVAKRGEVVEGALTWLPDCSNDRHPWPPGGSVVRMLAVRAEERNQGVAEALVNEAVNRSRDEGRRFVALHTAPFMAAATRLYLRLGFVRAEMWDFDARTHYSDGGGEAVIGTAFILDL